MQLSDKAMNYEIVRKHKSQETLIKSYDDVYGEMINKVESVKEYLPSITDDLYMLDEDVTRGDYLVALVRGLNLQSDDEKAYADVSRYYYGYQELKVARGLYLIDGTQAKPYEAMSKIDAYVASYRVLNHLGFKCKKDYENIPESLKLTLTEEQLEAIAGLLGSNFISYEDIATMTNNTTMTRRDTVNLLLELKDYANHNQGEDIPTPANNNLGLIVGLATGGIAIVGGLTCALIVFFKKKKRS